LLSQLPSINGHYHFLLYAPGWNMVGNFTFLIEAVFRFIVADLVNITWNVVTPLVSLYESCDGDDRALEGETVLY
jgi:hypothetical protein